MQNNPFVAPEHPKKLPGTFWGITSFFNPVRYGIKKANYKKFRESSKKQGLNLLAIELKFDINPFELSQEDADILVQLQGDRKNIIWQKEALLNIALDHLPKDCDKIVWIDGDILFKNDDWVDETSTLLEKYVVVQPFSHIFYLEQDQTDVNDLEAIPSGFEEGLRKPGIAYGVINNGIRALNGYPGHWGFAWSARKEIFDTICFYDRLVLGSADLIMAFSFYDKEEDNKYLEMVLVNDQLKQDSKAWMQAMYKQVNSSVSYAQGFVLHLWHGSIQDRNYKTRSLILKNNDFNPAIDIKKNDNGFWQWASDKPQLHQEVMDYFYLRNEDPPQS